MTIPVTLSKRMSKYLLKKNDWVNKYQLIKLAKVNNYAHHHVEQAFKELEKEVYVGKIYISRDDKMAKLPHGTYYRCYPMDEETQERYKKSLEWFDNL